jgi:hypothetical protein
VRFKPGCEDLRKNTNFDRISLYFPKKILYLHTLSELTAGRRVRRGG